MTLEEAKEYAKTMSYENAVYNALQGRAVPYKKATKIKLDELLKKAKELDGLKGENKLTCDRNICLKNEYNNIGCEDCIVMKGENK